MTTTQFHTCFKLNGNSFISTKELIKYSSSISSDIQSFLIEWFDESDFIKVKTSGSTGVPKIIEIKKEYMKNSALVTGNYFNLTANTTALLCMPINFIAGKMMLVRAMVLGWDLDIVAPKSNPLENNTKEYDFCAMVPFQLQSSLSEIHKIKKLIVGGAVVSKELLSEIQNIKTQVYATYGMTETITHISVKKLNQLDTVISSRVKKSNYQVLPNIKISIDSRNCLVIDAPSIADGKIITNDVVTIVSPTEFKWIGRFDNIVNSAGVKLIPEQIEEKITKIINERFFVIGIPDTILGQKLILIIENSNNLNKDIVLEKLKNLKSLTKYEIPKEVYFINKFIETETNKLNRKATLKLL